MGVIYAKLNVRAVQIVSYHIDAPRKTRLPNLAYTQSANYGYFLKQEA